MARIRATTLEDAAAVCALGSRIGLGEVDPAEWRRRWNSYPLASEFRDIPIGWVVEDDDGSIKGSFANVHVLYELGGKRLRVCIGCDWGVDPESRGMSLQLLNNFLRQKTDVCVVGSASAVTSEILSKLKVPRIPAPSYDIPLLWAVRSRDFMATALHKRGMKGAAALAWPLGLGLGVADFLRGSGRGRPSSPIRQADAFDERFDVFWERLRRGSTRLRAIRSRAVLDWRFAEAMKRGNAIILISERDHKLVGYAVLIRRPAPDFGLCTYDTADLQALGDDPNVLKDLLLASVLAAREGGAGMLKLVTGNATKRAIATGLRPHSYQLPLWQLFYKTGDSSLTDQLSTADIWDFSPLDTY